MMGVLGLIKLKDVSSTFAPFHEFTNNTSDMEFPELLISSAPTGDL